MSLPARLWEWVVIFGFYTLQFICFPRFEATRTRSTEHAEAQRRHASMEQT